MKKKEVINVVKFIVIIIIYTVMAVFLALCSIYLERLSQGEHNYHAEANIINFQQVFFDTPSSISFP